VRRAIEDARNGNLVAAYQADVIDALIAVKNGDTGAFLELRRDLKKANAAISLAELDRAMRASGRQLDPETHHSFAKKALADLTVMGHAPVFVDGELYVVDPTTNLWVPKGDRDVYNIITRNHDGHRLCSTRDDYRGIKALIHGLAQQQEFFAEGPVGVATPKGFYRVDGGEIRLEPLDADHRQRVRIAFDVQACETPLFHSFLTETFHSSDTDEMLQQIRLVQEIAGAIMLGLMHKQQKAVLFYDPYGRAGKGTLETVLRNLVPASFISAVSPFNWNKEYYLMALAGARLNVVGELPDDQSIPAAQFKSVIGLDQQTGRHPSGRPVLFRCEAAHLFMSNHLINTREHSEAFYSRWLIVEFPNSRLKSGLPIDPDVAARIVQDELPGIAHWALEGAQRLLKFSPSRAHDRLMERWRRASNSVEEFVYEVCELGAKLSVKRSELYQGYRSWCKSTGRLPFAAPKFKEFLLLSLKLGVTCVERNGYETFKGLKPKGEYQAPEF
jgi:P4 family phage/plasmid primase-like protien